MIESTKRLKPKKRIREPLYQCMKCGAKYYTVAAAERAMRRGCRCGGTDIDVYPGYR
jgi:hypothetical protein